MDSSSIKNIFQMMSNCLLVVKSNFEQTSCQKIFRFDLGFTTIKMIYSYLRCKYRKIGNYAISHSKNRVGHISSDDVIDIIQGQFMKIKTKTKGGNSVRPICTKTRYIL